MFVFIFLNVHTVSFPTRLICLIIILDYSCVGLLFHSIFELFLNCLILFASLPPPDIFWFQQCKALYFSIL